ncbi:bacteriohemerythrin [Thalassotalea sp. SU-HH00458]|uniref:bacteriohemerythrin n=1 Tax=Thalassotalea sp. SU-HH00458 TaxID=3127657 RepID=UPI00310988EC
MNNRQKSLLYAAIIGLIIVAIFLGFLSSITNPVSWLLIAVLLLIPMLDRTRREEKKIVWKEEYSVGIESLDQDHKTLIDLLNKFITAYDFAMSESFEREALDELIAYTKYHFEREEALMLKHHYPDVVEHKAEHKKMFEQVEKFEDLYIDKGHEALEEISQFLTNWLINHINGTDKAYTKHLTQCGVK